MEKYGVDSGSSKRGLEAFEDEKRPMNVRREEGGGGPGVYSRMDMLEVTVRGIRNSRTRWRRMRLSPRCGATGRPRFGKSCRGHPTLHLLLVSDCKLNCQ